MGEHWRIFPYLQACIIEIHFVQARKQEAHSKGVRMLLASAQLDTMRNAAEHDIGILNCPRSVQVDMGVVACYGGCQSGTLMISTLHPQWSRTHQSHESYLCLLTGHSGTEC